VSKFEVEVKKQLPIFIDNHEPQSIIQNLLSTNIDVDVRHITSGDYVFGEVGIERKTNENFIFSIINKKIPGQLWQQLELLNRTYDIPILLVEGSIKPESYIRLFEGSMDSITLFWKKLRVIRTKDEDHTAEKVKSLYIKYGIGKSGREPPAPVRKAKTPRQVRLYMLQCIEGVGPVTAKNIMKECPTFTELAHFAADPDILRRKIKGVSKKSAFIMSRVFSYI